jgi:hypothetical protein
MPTKDLPIFIGVTIATILFFVLIFVTRKTDMTLKKLEELEKELKGSWYDLFEPILAFVAIGSFVAAVFLFV